MPRSLTIGPHTLDDSSPALLVAEIGNNHSGSIREAHALVDMCADCGADVVKFQRRTIDALYTPEYLARPYTGPTSRGATYGDHRRSLELPDRAWGELQRHAMDRGMLLTATPFDLPAVAFLAMLPEPLPCVKVAAAFLWSRPLLDAVYGMGVPVLVSVPGSANMWDVGRVVRNVRHCARTCLLSTTSAYPTPDEGTNLRRVQCLTEAFPDVGAIGYSNHNPHGPIMPAAAYALGARVIEVHVTRDRSQRGTDHAMSLEANGLRKLASYLARLHDAMQVVDTTEMERPALHKMGHGLYAARDISAGHVLTEADLEMRSPANGARPDQLGDLVGYPIIEEIPAHVPVDRQAVETADCQDRAPDAHQDVGDRDDRRRD